MISQIDWSKIDTHDVDDISVVKNATKNTDKSHRNVITKFRYFLSADAKQNGGLGLKLSIWDSKIRCPQQFVEDKVFQIFLHRLWHSGLNQKYKVKSKSNIRAVHGWMSVMVQFYNFGVDLELANFVLTFKKYNDIKIQPEYKKNESEQIPEFTQGDITKLENAVFHFYNNGRVYCKRELLQFCMVSKYRRSDFARGNKVSELLEGHIKRLNNAMNGQIRIYAQVGPSKTINISTTNSIYSCSCVVGQGSDGKLIYRHNPQNFKCDVARFDVFDRLKKEDDKYTKSRMKLKCVKWENLGVFRKTAWINKKEAKNLGLANSNDINLISEHIWYTRNPLAVDKGNKACVWLDNALNLSISQGTNPTALQNKRRVTFGSHTDKRTEICDTEENVGDQMPMNDKLLIARHKTADTYNHYANKGNIAREKAKVRKEEIILKNKLKKERKFIPTIRYDMQPFNYMDMNSNTNYCTPQQNYPPPINDYQFQMNANMNINNCISSANMPQIPQLPQLTYTNNSNSNNSNSNNKQRKRKKKTFQNVKKLLSDIGADSHSFDKKDKPPQYKFMPQFLDQPPNKKRKLFL